jgi:hypothetical protein
MNDSTEQWLAKLEQATSASTAEPMDDETAKLRESWLAFSQLVSAADAEAELPTKRPQGTRRVGLIVKFIAALAASLLIAFAAWTMLQRGSRSVRPAPGIAAPSNFDVGGEFAWEDSFDEQLALTNQAMRAVQADWSGGDRRYSLLLDQFKQFSEELSEGSL